MWITILFLVSLVIFILSFIFSAINILHGVTEENFEMTAKRHVISIIAIFLSGFSMTIFGIIWLIQLINIL